MERGRDVKPHPRHKADESESRTRFQNQRPSYFFPAFQRLVWPLLQGTFTSYGQTDGGVEVRAVSSFVLREWRVTLDSAGISIGRRFTLVRALPRTVQSHSGPFSAPPSSPVPDTFRILAVVGSQTSEPGYFRRERTFV